MTSIKTAIFHNERIAWVLAACVLAGVLLIGNAPLVSGKAGPLWDADAYYAPLFSLVGDYTQAGKLFLWNPWMNGGSPDFADPQTGATSPILLAFGTLSSNPLHGFVAYWMTFWFFGGLGMLLLCRHLKCPPWGSLIAALGFIASGFYTGHGEHTTILYSFSLLPWVVWRFDAGITQRSYWNMVQAGVLWGLSALGGYPALVIMDPIFLALWGLGRAYLEPSEADFVPKGSRRSRLGFTAAGLVLLGVVGVVIMCPTYLGFMVYTQGYTSRAGGISREYALTSGPLPPQALSTLTSSFIYLLNSPPIRIWPETDISMSSIYVGVLVVSLAAIALFKLHKWRFWIAFVVAFFLCCAVGNHLPVRGWLYDLVIPTRYFRFPSLFSAYAIVGLCILGAYGARDIDAVRLSSDTRSRGRFAAIAALVAVLATLSYLWVMRSAYVKLSSVAHPTKIFLILWLSTLVLLVLWWKRDITSRLLLTGLIVLAVFDATSALSTGSITMYSINTRPWWKLLTTGHVKSLDLTPHGFGRLLYPATELGRYQENRNVVLKIATFANDTGMVNPFFQPYVADPILNQIAIGEQRIWFSDHAVWLPPNEEAFDEYVTASHALGVPPLVLHSPEEMLKGSTTTRGIANSGIGWVQAAQPMSRAEVSLIAYFPNRLAFRYNAAEDGWLLVTDRWAPYWHATVNGRALPIEGAGFIFRAVPVTRGENTVMFRYEPKGYVALVALSWGTLLVFLGWEVRRQVLRRRAVVRQPIGDVSSPTAITSRLL